MPKKHKIDTSENLNGTLFPPNTTWVMPGYFPDLSGAKLIGFDCETKDPNLMALGPGFIRGDAHVCGIALGTYDRSWYFPMRHLGGGNLDPGIVSAYVKDVMALPCDKVAANAAYDLEALWSEGISVKGKVYDIQVIESLLEEEREEGYDLGTLCKIHLGTKKEETLLKDAASAYNVDPKGGLWKLPSKYVGAYAEYDVTSTIQIFEKQKLLVAKDDLAQIVDLETRVTPVLHQMRIKGCPIDEEAAAKLSITLKQTESKLYDELLNEHKERINPLSALDLAGACDRKSITYPRSTTGLPSFEGKWLEEHPHPMLQLVATIRQTQKLKKDFVDNLIKRLVKGRLHTQWVQLMSEDGGTKSGRLASKNPNNQQIPATKRRNGKPNPIGAAIRALYIPEPGKLWFKNDYSQQEPRILVHFAALCKFDGAEAAAFSYRANPDMDFYNFVVDICNVNRRRAKDIYLSISYNQGLKAFAESIGQSKEQAKSLLHDFNTRLPFIRQISDKCTQLAQTRGYVKTLLGRKRHFNYWEPANAYNLRDQGVNTTPVPLAKAHEKWPGMQLIRAWTHKGLNSVIQGSAADMMKMGLVKGYEEDGRVPHLSVHDEVDGSVEDEADGLKWKRTMETCVELNVPIKGDMSIGKHWK
jgi:DNA polymerase-1